MLRSLLFAGLRSGGHTAQADTADQGATIGRPSRRAKTVSVISCAAFAGASAVWLGAADSIIGQPAATVSVAEMARGVRGTDAFVREAKKIDEARIGRREWAFGGYGGVAHTYPTTVTVKNGDQTDMTATGFDWIGRPFKAPIYYGLRIQRWGEGRIGGMLDFTHAKAIAKPDSEATFTGQHNGQDLPERAPIGQIFNKLEFSHGHNMLTLNGLLRLVPSWFRVRPYLGAGGGISLPHTEVGFRGDNVRTYEYQFTGFVGQTLAGLEVQIGRASIFFEYKFTYAPYDVPLSQTRHGDLLVTDLWRQFQAWRSGEPPPGGRLTTTLVSHHGIAGVLIKNGTYVDQPQ